jgi:hypothetical protein
MVLNRANKRVRKQKDTVGNFCQKGPGHTKIFLNSPILAKILEIRGQKNVTGCHKGNKEFSKTVF